MALVVGRKDGESIIIGDLIKITVVEVKDTLRLKIDAPKEINIVREEIYDQKISNEEALVNFARTHEKLFKLP